MTLFLALLAAAAVPSKTVFLAPDVLAGAKPLRLECPVGQSTRVVFPRADLGVKVSSGAKEKLGLRRLASRPETVILFAPPKHPGRGTLELTGPGIDVLIAAETTERGGGREIRFTLEPPGATAEVASKTGTPVAAVAPGPGPDATPVPVGAVAVSPTRRPTSGPAASARPKATATTVRAVPAAPVQAPALPNATAEPSPSAEAEGRPTAPGGLASPEPSPSETSADPDAAEAQEAGIEDAEQAATTVAAVPAAATGMVPTFDSTAFLAAKPVKIGRREGQPGYPDMVLQDALKGERWVWLRFLLEDRGAHDVDEVAWERGTNRGQGTYTLVPAPEGLMVVVQVPREEVTTKTRVTVKVRRGGRYKFALGSGKITDVIKKFKGESPF